MSAKHKIVGLWKFYVKNLRFYREGRENVIKNPGILVSNFLEKFWRNKDYPSERP